MTEQPSDAAVEAARKTAEQCLGNRIMALRETRCEAHKHYLCDVCAGQWIAAHTDKVLQDHHCACCALKIGTW